jgi:hypothetical protein
MLDGKTCFQFDKEDGFAGIPTKLLCGENGTLKTTLTSGKKCSTPALRTM